MLQTCSKMQNCGDQQLYEHGQRIGMIKMCVNIFYPGNKSSFAAKANEVRTLRFSLHLSLKSPQISVCTVAAGNGLDHMHTPDRAGNGLHWVDLQTSLHGSSAPQKQSQSTQH